MVRKKYYQNAQLPEGGARPALETRGYDERATESQQRIDTALQKIKTYQEQYEQRLNSTESQATTVEQRNTLVKEYLFGPVKAELLPQGIDVQKLSVEDILQQVGQKPALVEALLQGIGAKDEAAQVAETHTETQLQVQNFIGEHIVEVDHAPLVQKAEEATKQIVALEKTPGSIREGLGDRGPLGWMENGVRGLLNMQPAELASRHAFDFITSFRAEEAKERGLFTPDSFQQYLDKNSNLFLPFFNENKAGVQSFLRFFQDSPNSARETFGAIDAQAASLAALDGQLLTLERTLGPLLSTTVRGTLQQQLEASVLAPLRKTFGLPKGVSLQADMQAVRQRMKDLRATVASLRLISDMPLQKKMAYMELLDRAKAGRMTHDTVMVGLFAIEVLLAANGGVIPDGAGNWAGTEIVRWAKEHMPAIQIDREWFMNMMTPVLVTLGMSAVGKTVAEIRKAQEAAKILPGGKEAQEVVGEEQQKVMQKTRYAMRSSGFSRGSEQAILQALEGDGKVQNAIWEDARRVGQFRGYLVQVRNEIAAELTDTATTEQKNQANQQLQKLAQVFNQMNEVKEGKVPRLLLEEMVVEKASRQQEMPEVVLQAPETPISTIVENALRSTLLNINAIYQRAFGTTWKTEKFPTMNVETVFGRALYNSLLRAILKNPQGEYLQQQANFSTSTIGQWEMQLRAQASNLKLRPEEKALLQGDLDATLKSDPEFIERLQRAMKGLMDGATNQFADKRAVNPHEDASFQQGLRHVVSTGPATVVDAGLTEGERQEAMRLRQQQGEKKQQLERVVQLVQAPLEAVANQLKVNPAFDMLSVLRVNILQAQPGEAMSFLLKQLQETMKGDGAAFVQAWSLLQKNPQLPGLVRQFEQAEKLAHETGVEVPGLQALEGEVGAIRALQALDATEVMQLVEAANQPDGWAMLSGAWFLGKMAVAIVGWDRATSWIKMPNVSQWKLPEFAWPWMKAQTAPVSVAPTAASSMVVDGAGIAWAAGLWTAQMSAAALLANREKVYTPKVPGQTQRVEALDPTRLGVALEKELEVRFAMTQEGGRWRFAEEQQAMQRVDRLMNSSGANMDLLREGLRGKYGVSSSEELRRVLTEEVQKNFQKRKEAVMAYAIQFTEQMIQQEASQRSFTPEQKTTWIEQERLRAKSYLSLLQTQLSR